MRVHPFHDSFRGAPGRDMKHLIKACCLNLCVAGHIVAQSWSVAGDYTPQTLWDVAFTSASVGVIVGQQGQVYRSVDGGATWSFLDLSTTEILKTVYFADVNRGFILGTSMYQTTNAGASWATTGGPGLPMEGIYFVDNQRGTVVGANGSIFHTTNGGGNWTPQASNVSNTLKAVWFTSENDGIIVGEAGIILQTTDGGQSWSRHLSGTLQDLNSIFFLNATVGFISGGNGTILRTTDGGLNWLPAVVESSVVSLLKVKMLDASNGFAFGNGSNIVAPIDFFRTTDGGITWRRQSYGENRAVQFYGMAVIDPMHLVVVGNSGTVMRSPDGGTTWQSQELMPGPDLLGVTAPFSGVLSRAFVAASSTGFSFESSSGTTWGINRYTSRALRAVHGAGTSLNAHTSIMVGDFGTVVVSHVNQNVGSRITVQLRSDLTLRGVFMVDRDTAYIVADSGYVFKSTNRGASWTSLYSGARVRLNGICFADAMDGFAVGDSGRIRRSTDFGQSWIGATSVTAERLNAISFASPNVGIIVGQQGTILRTSNGGNSWLVRISPVGAELRSVAFVNPARGLAVGDSGRIIGTNDGGLTWQIQPSPVNVTLRGVTFMNDSVAVAVGDRQTIVRTTSGVTSVAENAMEEVPSGYLLAPNYPNPFNPTTVISYQLPATSNVDLTVFDVLGREVRTLVNEEKPAGYYTVRFDGTGLASGAYFYRLRAGNFVQTRKLTMVR